MSNEITELEQEIGALMQRLDALRKTHQGSSVPDYVFTTLDGTIALRELFG
jgi:hypothetical protein